jgi:hypothetical protein
MIRTAKCKCGEVEFQLTGEPVFNGPWCSCNDCVTAAHYVDNKAKAEGKTNISSLEVGNPQTQSHALFPVDAIRLVKGGANIRFFKNKPGTNAVRTYTSCCCTTGESLSHSRSR